MTRLKDLSRSAAADVRREFLGTFAEVQRTAQTALQLPRTTGGGLDLSQEIAQLKAQEAAAQNSAQAQRELAAAATAVAARGGESAAAQRLTADAAMVAERASIEEATAIRSKIRAYEELQAELSKTASGTRTLSQEERQLVETSNAARAGMQQIGQQASDFAVQVVSGQSALTAFAQQFPQAVGALTLFADSGKAAGAAVSATGAATEDAGANIEGMGEKVTGIAEKVENTGSRFGRFAAFLAGPWGAALTVATVVAVPLVSKLLEGAEAADQQAEKLMKATSAADSYGAAQSLLGQIMDLTTGKMKTQNEVLIQQIKLQAQSNILAAEKKQKEAAKTLKGLASPSFLERLSVTGAGTPFSANGSAAQDQAQKLTASLGPLKAVLGDYVNLVNDPRAKPEQLTAGLDAALERLDKLSKSGKSGKLASRDLIDTKAAILALGTTINDRQANSEVLEAIKTGKLSDGLRIDKPGRTKREPKPKDYSRSDDAAEQAIAAINAEWDDQPRLIDKARLATLKLDNLTEQLGKRELTPEVQKLLGLIDQARESIKDGIDRPFREFVEAQQESLEVGRLVLAGRDADAEAMQNILRLQQQMGPLNEAQVQTAYRLAQQHQAINRLLEDQRRIVGIYENAWGGVLDQVDGVFAKIQGNAGGITGVAQKLQRDLLSNALFGGIDREIEDYIRKMTGKQTPAEILQDQAKGAAVVLRDTVNDFVDALADATVRIRGYDPASVRTATALAAPAVSQFFGGGGYSANDNDIVVTGKVGAGEALGLVRSSKVLEIAIDGWAKRMEKLGITVPETITKGLKGNLGTLLEGAAFGGIGGSVFSALGGGKADKTASGIGGILGEYGGKELGKTITKEIGGSLGKTLGGIAGPLGAIAGGILGNVVGGLFQKTERGSAQITGVDQAAVVNGNYSAVQSDLGGLATNVQTGIRQIADALGADVGRFAVSINKYKDSYRVDPNGGTSVGGKYGTNDGVLKFDNDPEGAVRAAIANALADGAIKGISDASQRILASGKDLESAINKAVLIEAVPRNLKKLLDPVGAAIDDLNRDFKKTVDALKEGGASAEQMAQAQQLYNLQLEQVKASTASASQTLKDFQSSLKLGSNSPYSLRDQEREALAKLQPFLDQIALGKSIDQSAYQSAANTAIDIERQIYGSTKQFFDFLDLIQGATNKAISSIDNAAPVSAAVDSPFASATASSTASTAKNTATLTEQTDDTNALLARIADTLAQIAGGSAGANSFISDARNFATR
nr:hypothetical protein [Sphingomonas sp. S2M10]